MTLKYHHWPVQVATRPGHMSKWSMWLLICHYVAIKWSFSLLMVWVSLCCQQLFFSNFWLTLRHLTIMSPHSHKSHMHLPPPKQKQHGASCSSVSTVSAPMDGRTHHQRKLQRVKPPRVQVEYLCQRMTGKHHHHTLFCLRWLSLAATYGGAVIR